MYFKPFKIGEANLERSSAKEQISSVNAVLKVGEYGKLIASGAIRKYQFC
jgi:hypothetical protein